MPYKDEEAKKRNRRDHYLRNKERVKAQVAARRATPEGTQKARAATKAWKAANPRAALAHRDQEALKRPGLSKDWGVRILAVIPDAWTIGDRAMLKLDRQHVAALRMVREGWRPEMTEAEIYRARYRNNVRFAIKERLRNQLTKARGQYGWVAHYFGVMAKKGGGKRIWDVVGYSAGDLRAHLHRQFTQGMTWERFLAGEIHIDHIVPKSTFDLDTLVGVRACFALSNLRPLWASDNLRKSARRTHLC